MYERLSRIRSTAPCPYGRDHVKELEDSDMALGIFQKHRNVEATTGLRVQRCLPDLLNNLSKSSNMRPL